MIEMWCEPFMIELWCLGISQEYLDLMRFLDDGVSDPQAWYC